MSNKCVIHYPHIQISDYTKLTPVDQSRFDRLVSAKDARVQLGGVQYHESQCRNLPESLVESSLLYHRECYNQFCRAFSE